MSPSNKPSEGFALIFTFPFPIYVKEDSELTIQTVDYKDQKLRVYPFFRSAPTNFVPAPSVDMTKLPYPRGIRVNFSGDPILPRLQTFPKLGLKSDGRRPFLLSWGDSDDPTHFPKDSLRIDTLSHDDRGRDVAILFVQGLLEMVRVRSNQHWIGRSSVPLYLANTLPITENGAPNGDYPYIESRTPFTVTGEERPVDNAIWIDSIRALYSGENLPFYLSLLLDAKNYVYQPDIRRSVIDAATACEQARDYTFERIWEKKNSNRKFKRSRMLSDMDLPKHLSEDLYHYTNQTHSYKNVDPEGFERIQALWQTRGNVAHGGDPYYYKDNRRIDVDQALMLKFVQTVSVCVKWLESIK